MNKRNLARTSVIASCLAVALTGCGTKAAESNDDSGAIKTGPGVTADTIRIGSIGDLSGVFAAVSQVQSQGRKYAWERINDDGGVCDRQIEWELVDNAYAVDKTLVQYQQLQPDVVGFDQSSGGPQTAALVPRFQQDTMIGIPASWSSSLLESGHVMIVGTTYEHMAANAVDWLIDNDMIASGDKIGEVYLEGDYGADNLLGAQQAADAQGLELSAASVVGTDTDLSSVATRLKRDDVKAILFAGTPGQLASLAGVATSIGLEVPIVSASGGFSPSLLTTGAADALEKNVYVTTSWLMPSDVDSADVQAAVEAYKKENPDVVMSGDFVIGYGAALAFAAVLEDACDAGDLSRQGVMDAFNSIGEVDTDGIYLPLDFSDPTKTASTGTYVWEVDSAAPEGLSLLTDEAYVGTSVE